MAATRAKIERLDAELRLSAAEHKRQIELDDAALAQAAAAFAPRASAPVERGAGDLPGSIRGFVDAVNNEVDVVIVSVGKRDGVTEGTEFAVTRDGSPVATIVIDKVFPNYSSGTFKPFTPKTPIRAGDECVGRAATYLPK
jgi:hypothetical protein